MLAELRARIQRGFGSFAGLIHDRCRVALAVVAVVTAGLASGIPSIEIDTSNEAFLHPDDPILTAYGAFKEQFGRDDIIIVAVEAPELFGEPALRRLEALHRDLAGTVPYLADIISMVNARDTRGEGDTLNVDDLLARWPATPAARAALRARVMENPLYRNRLISADGRITTVVLELDAYGGSDAGESALRGFDEAPPAGGGRETRPLLTDDENRAAVEAVQAVVARHDAEGFRLRVAGMPVVTEALKRAIQRDMGRFMLLALVTIGVFLYVVFRRVTGVLLPLLVVVLSLLSTLGLMGYAGVSIKIPTVILPSLLLAVGVGAAVHILAIFYRALEHHRERRPAIVEALGHSGLAIVLTSLTTAAGLGSFATAEVAPIADLGRFASAGVLLSLLYTVVLLPALLAMIPVKPRGEPAARRPLDRAFDRIAEYSTRHARAIVAATLVLIAGSGLAAAQLRFSHDVLAWLPSDWPVYRATRAIDRALRGSVVLEVVLDTGRENGLYDRELLVDLDRLARELEGYDRNGLFIGKATSVADILKEINRALQENRPEFYVIPANARLIPQEFLLFENSGSDDLEEVVDSRFQLARFTIRVPWRDTLEYVPLIRHIESRFRSIFGARAEITVTGVMSLLSRTLDAAIRSAAKSYAIAFVVISVLMIGLIGSVRIGLVSMVPNLAPIVVTVGLMWLTGIPLNMFTMLVGSIAIGLAVDDTIHFMHNFRRYYDERGDVEAAVRETLHTTGRAMVVTTAVLAAGFFVFALASLNNVIQFGLLTGTAILLALAADFIVTPALMVLCHSPSGSRITRTSGDRP